MSADRDRILRIVDVNRNRALEALRVVEEHARFALESPHARRVKALRHDVQRILAAPAFAGALANRDVAGDPGRPAVVSDTRPRADSTDVLGANMSRAKESLRALEEYAKALDGEASVALSRARYDLYALEADLARPSLSGRAVYVLLGEAEGRPSLEEQARACLAGGVRLFQLRLKQVGDRDLLTRARAIREILAAEDAFLIVNDRPDLARLADAHGVHLGRGDLPAREARRIVGPGLIVGASAHDAAELRAALEEGADYVGIGTLFSSPTKPELPARGLELVSELAPACPVPTYGIGGVTLANAAEVIAAGADGVAVSSAILDAKDIAQAAAELVDVVAKA